jgi:glycerol-3-phosphate acyltransferase PlsY
MIAPQYPGTLFRYWLIYNIAWKTFIYVLAVALARYLEHFIPLLVKGKGVAEANHEIPGEFVWPRLLAIHIWFVVLFLFYSVLAELVRALGKERVFKMFFGRDYRKTSI